MSRTGHPVFLATFRRGRILRSDTLLAMDTSVYQIFAAETGGVHPHLILNYVGISRHESGAISAAVKSSFKFARLHGQVTQRIREGNQSRVRPAADEYVLRLTGI